MEKILEEKIAARLSITEAEANRIWNVCRDSLIESISENPVFGIRNLGAWSHVAHPGGMLPHPQTGVIYLVEPYKKVEFSAGKGLKDAVNAEKPAEDTNDGGI